MECKELRLAANSVYTGIGNNLPDFITDCSSGRLFQHVRSSSSLLKNDFI